MSDDKSKNAKILIVDDQESNLAVLEKLLKKKGYENFKSLTDPRRVVPTFQEWQPDLILLDLMMPNMDGFAVMEALKPGAYGEWRDDGAWPHFDPAPCSHKFRPGDRVMMVYPAGWEYHVGLDNSRNVVDQQNPYYVVCWDVDGFGDGWRESHLHTTDK